MDDLEVLARMRADVPDADTLVLRRARRQLLAHAVGPRLAVARPRRRLVIRVAVAAGLAAVLAGGVIAADAFTHNGRPVTGASAEAADLLGKAAVHARDPKIGPGQFRYVVTHAWYQSGYGGTDGTSRLFLAEQRYETWIPYNEAGTWFWQYTRPLKIRSYKPEDEQWLRQNDPDAFHPHVERYIGHDGLITADVGADGTADGSHTSNGASPAGWQTPTSQWLATLPRDPGALLDRIHRDSRGQGHDRDSETLVFIGDVLRSGLVPADLRSALFRTAALVPGVRIIDHATNLDGRRGVAVGRDDVQFVFDPKTYAFIGEREVTPPGERTPGYPAGLVRGETAVTVSVVDHPGFRVRG